MPHYLQAVVLEKASVCIPWTAKVINRQLLEHIKSDISLEGKIAKFCLFYFSHVMQFKLTEKGSFAQNG